MGRYLTASVEVEVFYHDFDTEQAALEYAISNQRNRRNLTDADIFRCIEALDKRKPQGQRTDLTSIDVRLEPARSSTQTAALVGTSQAKIERARTVLDHGSADIQAAVQNGDMSIHKAVHTDAGAAQS